MRGSLCFGRAFLKRSMGKNLIQQARGKGGPRYRAPSFRYKGQTRYMRQEKGIVSGKIIDLIHCPGHSSPLAEIEYNGKDVVLIQAPEGVRIGDLLEMGDKVDVKKGNVMPLKNMPEGTAVYNIEASPGDGGKFVRT